MLVTTCGKLCDEINFSQCYEYFAEDVDKSKLFLVSHEAQHAADAGKWDENLITLRELNYKQAKSVVVNPHSFGKVNINAPKNNITNFITIGAIKDGKKNNQLIIDAVKNLHNQGICNFKITVIGKGHLKNLPEEIQNCFDIKGKLTFDKMYEEMEKADFLITAYDKYKPEHIRYNTSGTSGNFQLVYGFNTPCVIIGEFAPINGFNDTNAILYDEDKDFTSALKRAVNLSIDEYDAMKKSLYSYSNSLYNSSKQNLKNLIAKRKTTKRKGL